MPNRRRSVRASDLFSPRDHNSSSDNLRRVEVSLTKISLPPTGVPVTPRTSAKANAFIQLEDVSEQEERLQVKQSHYSQVSNRHWQQFESPSSQGQTVAERRIKQTVGENSRSNNQIREHYSKCLKLLTENKINIKNAFSLHLIDLLPDLISGANKESSEGAINFQVAGASLDASAKIYASRVDVVHQATFQMMGGLGKTAKGEKFKETNRDENDSFMDDDSGGDVPVAVKRKREKKPKGRTVEKTLKNISLPKVECEHQADPLFRKVCLTLEEPSSGGLLSNAVHITDDKNRLQLHSYEVEDKEWEPKVIETVFDPNALFVSKRFKDLVADILNDDSSSHLCPSLASLKFGEDTALDDSGAEDPGTQDADDNLFDDFCPIDLPTTMSADKVAAPEWGEQDNDMDLGEGGMDEMGDVLGPLPERNTILQENEGMPSYEEVAKSISLKQLDYSYFSPKALETWKGPENWKMKNVKRAKLFGSDDGSQDKKKPRKKKAPLLDFEADENAKIDPGTRMAWAEMLALLKGQPADLSQFPKPSRAATQIKKETQRKYKEEDTLMAPSISYSPSDLFKLYLKDARIVKTSQSSSDGENQSPAMMIVDSAVPDLNLEDMKETLNYEGPCNAADTMLDVGGDDMDDDDDDVIGGGGDIDFTAAPEDPDAAGDEAMLRQGIDNLIEEPTQVRGLQIKYAKTAKRVDVRKLKAAMWGILTKKQPLRTIDTNTGAEALLSAQEQLEGTSSFADLCAQLPKAVTPRMLDNLSVPTVFVSFLHMCNEKVLKLTPQENMMDFEIVQD